MSALFQARVGRIGLGGFTLDSGLHGEMAQFFFLEVASDGDADMVAPVNAGAVLELLESPNLIQRDPDLSSDKFSHPLNLMVLTGVRCTSFGPLAFVFALRKLSFVHLADGDAHDPVLAGAFFLHQVFEHGCANCIEPDCEFLGSFFPGIFCGHYFFCQLSLL